MKLWDPEPVYMDCLGQEVTFISPSAMDAVRLKTMREAMGDDEISDEDGVKLFQALVKAGIAEYRNDVDTVESMPMHVLQELGNRVIQRLNAQQEYADEQKKR